MSTYMIGLLYIFASTLVHQLEAIVVKNYGKKYGKGGMFFNAILSAFAVVYFVVSDLLLDKSGFQLPMSVFWLGALNSLIPSTICMVFTVSVILTVKENMSVESVIEGLLKLCALPIVGLRGMLDGYRFAREDKSAWLETKARLLESFIGE